jgi:hypothetical protein
MKPNTYLRVHLIVEDGPVFHSSVSLYVTCIFGPLSTVVGAYWLHSTRDSASRAASRTKSGGL